MNSPQQVFYSSIKKCFCFKMSANAATHEECIFATVVFIMILFFLLIEADCCKLEESLSWISSAAHCPWGLLL